MSQAQAARARSKKPADPKRAKGTQAPPPRPLRRDAEANRLRILAAAGEVFAEYGLEATLDDVAAHAGVGVGTVYRRFPDKHALAQTLFQQRIDEVVQLAESALQVKDPWKAIEHLMMGLMSLQAPDRGLREVILHGRCGGDQIRESRDRILPIVTQIVTRAQSAGVLRPDISPTDFPMFDLMVSSVSEHTSSVAPDLWRRYVSILLDGLRVRRTKFSELQAPPLSAESLEAAMTSVPRVRGDAR